MFGLGAIGTLIIYGVVAAVSAAAVYTAWNGFKEHIAAPYVQAQMKADQIIITKANKGQELAEAAQAVAEQNVVMARGNTDRCELALGDAGKAKDKAELNAKANLEESRKIKAEADRQRAASAPYIAGLQAVAAAKSDKAATCEQQLERARPVLQEALRRQRGVTTLPVPK